MENPLISNIDNIVFRLRECIAHSRKINQPDVSVADEYISMRAPSSSEIYGIDSAVEEIFIEIRGRSPEDREWRSWHAWEELDRRDRQANPNYFRPKKTIEAWTRMLDHFLGARVFLSKLLHEQAHIRENEAARTPSHQYKEIIMGDVFKNISNSSIINRSAFFDTMSSLEAKSEPELMSALEHIADEVEKSGNNEAGELLEQLMEEISREKPRQSLIKRTWSGLTDILPSVAKIATATAALGKLIS
ncbi:hypothetical protein [Jannaschia sp. CCS1]|uniref:hypothetical protein n=1 Tax=Jannaschia sp. (strain CCS1) TaxID=290400 RepID=UPI00140FBF9B|nr:hypothetical protein [Jannaschia sp. CCS1]